MARTFARRSSVQIVSQRYYDELVAKAAAASGIEAGSIRCADARRITTPALCVRDALIAYLMQTYTISSIARVSGMTNAAVQSSRVRHWRTQQGYPR
jgi:hypothetical protein